jgi:hypothetical protein
MVIGVQMVHGMVPYVELSHHENFAQARMDLSIIRYKLEPIKILCEHVLEHIIDVNYTQNVSLSLLTVSINYSEHDLNASRDLLQQYQASLSDLNVFLEEIKGKSESYNYLREFIGVFKQLEHNLTGIVKYYSLMISNFCKITMYFTVSYSINMSYEATYQLLSDTRYYIEYLHTSCTRLRHNILQLDGLGFSITYLESLLELLTQTLTRYENYVIELSELFLRIRGYLTLYVSKCNVYLGETIEVWGYFFSEGDFIPEHNITLIIEPIGRCSGGRRSDNVLGETYTDTLGRFEITMEIPLTWRIGKFKLYVATTYQSRYYKSVPINITISPILTILMLYSDRTNYTPDAIIQFHGRLVDYKNRPLADRNITFYFDSILIRTDIITNMNGNFTFKFAATTVKFGPHEAYVTFTPAITTYADARSNLLRIYVNLPTEITINVNSKVILQDAPLLISGQVMDLYTCTPIKNARVLIHIDTTLQIETVTDEEGTYRCKYSTSGLSFGTHIIQARFVPTTVKWRDAVSEPVKIQVRKAEAVSFIEPFIMIGLIVSIFCGLILVVVIYRIRSVRKIGYTAESIERRAAPHEVPHVRLARATNISRRLSHLINLSDNRRAILLGYNILLSYLISQRHIRGGISQTHLDIERELVAYGYPSNLVRETTATFELVMYGNREVDKLTVRRFIRGTQRICKFIPKQPAHSAPGI